MNETKKYWCQVAPLRKVVVEIIKEEDPLGNILVLDKEHDSFMFLTKKENLETINHDIRTNIG